MMELQKVYFEEDFGMGYCHRLVGLRVNDKIIWFASNGDRNEFEMMESLVDEIVQKCGKNTCKNS